MSSRPLFASVAESIVIFGPMDHVGCASASSTVTDSSSSSDRFLNGPPDAVRTTESTVCGARPSRHWKSAECSLSTGRSSPPPRFHAAIASSPAATRLSLFASASVTPRSSAQSVAPTPAKPTTAFRTRSGSAASRSSVESPPTWTCSTPCCGCKLVERLRSRRERADRELGIGRDHLERLAPDRAGRPEQGDSSLAHGRRLTADVFRHALRAPEREDREVRGRARPRAASRAGRASLRGRRARVRSPSPRGRASPPTRRGRRARRRARSTSPSSERLRDGQELLAVA